MKLIAHPYASHRLGDFLIRGLGSDALSFAGASAFARTSGIKYLETAISHFSSDRSFRLTVGIDLHGTSFEALEMLLASAGDEAELFVFHNPGVTFHPKIFRFEYRDRWEVYSGSGNLTKGGLFENYEAGFVLLLKKGDANDEEVNQRITAEFQRWSDSKTPTVEAISSALIKRLATHKLLLREAAIRRLHGLTRKAALRGGGASSSPFERVATPPASAVPVSGNSQPGDTGSGGTITTFVMTLGGSETNPTKGRSPEFFIPKRARDMRPDYWGWPELYTQKGDAMNRYNTPLRFQGRDEPSTMFGYADRSEFRLRNSRIKAAITVDDILRIRHDESDPNLPYDVDIVSKGTTEYAQELARCVNEAQGSDRVYGYY